MYTLIAVKGLPVRHPAEQRRPPKELPIPSPLTHEIAKPNSTKPPPDSAATVSNDLKLFMSPVILSSYSGSPLTAAVSSETFNPRTASFLSDGRDYNRDFLNDTALRTQLSD